MKITMNVEVELTPLELRESLGLPNIGAVQDRLLAKMEEKINDFAEKTDPAKVMSLFMPDPSAMINMYQKMFTGKANE